MHRVTFTNFSGQLITREFATLAEAVKLIKTLRALGINPRHLFEE